MSEHQMQPSYLPNNLADDLENLLSLLDGVANKDICRETIDYLRASGTAAFNKNAIEIDELQTFLPPRLVDAARKGSLAIFFGAGLSIPCGIPGWNELLGTRFGLDKGFLDDEDLRSDPLTIAELASHQIGQEELQQILRSTSLTPRVFSVSHAILASLRLPIYITTNYDNLFEKAWRRINGTDIPVIVNNADLKSPVVQAALSDKLGVLIKIHGSADREDEYMILTRRDYRRHYRLNHDFFENIKSVIANNHVLFLGFSHKDPEVSRLVEDVVYDFENSKPTLTTTSTVPHFYSLQFDMSAHTPEVFAARGFVALQPPAPKVATGDYRSRSLATALADLGIRKAHAAGPDTSLYDEFRLLKSKVEKDVDGALSILEQANSDAIDALHDPNSSCDFLDNIQISIGELASQGVYLVNDQGVCRAHRTPPSIPMSLRTTTANYSRRPYFQQAKSFREPFISDAIRSIYNNRSTFFICSPILNRNRSFVGLLFSACQIGQWQLPIKEAGSFWSRGYSVFLLDSNGNCLLPPDNEFPLEDYKEGSGKNQTGKNANIGYDFVRLKCISHRDRLAERISQSIVPISLDDDIMPFGTKDLQFSVIAEIARTRWKLALSQFVTR